MTPYLIVKLLHIIAGIVAVGFNLSYLLWFFKGKKQPEHLLFALKGIKLMDDWLANPSYALSLLTGLLMSYLGGFDILKMPWIFYSLLLFGLLTVIAFGFYTPALSRQIRTLQTQGFQTEAYKKADKRQTRIGFLLFAISLTIVALMVIKPDLPIF